MNLNKSIAMLAVLAIYATHLIAQDKLPIKFGKVSLADFEIKSAVIDSNTNAVVVADVGKSDFIANTSDLSFSLSFKHKKRIKLINKNGFDAATIIIPLYVSEVGNQAERLDKLAAYTYNIEDGQVVETKLDASDVFTEKHSKNIVYKKFTFPAIKAGSILEYSYQINSDFIFNLQPWSFQGEYPVLWSQYEAAIPDFFHYVTLSQGYQPFFINTVDKTRQNFMFVEKDQSLSGQYDGAKSRFQTYKIDGNIDYHTWIIKDVPALKEEPFTSTILNFINRIEFQLKEIVYPNTFPKNYMNSWEQSSKDLLASNYFGVQINKPNNWLDNDVESISKTATTPKAKAKKIYEFVRDNYVCNDNNSYYITTSLKEVVKNKSGSVADINMLLIAMLQTQKISAEPVLLSTRKHGFTHELYPLMYRYNYVVARLNIDNEIIYLDAASPRLAFGKLPLKVYNGQARIINEQAPAVYFRADSLEESNSTTVFINNVEKGGVEGWYANNMGYYNSLDLRNSLAKTTLIEFTKALKENYVDDIELKNIVIDSLKRLDDPVSLKFDLKLNLFGASDIVYFNPLMGDAMKKNPFAAANRYYPVEMPYTKDDLYVLNMEIPKGYLVDELPKSTRINLNGEEGMFEYIISADNESIQLRCRLVIKKAKFLNEDYQTLRDFYAFIVNKEAEQIVFKKIK